jgi:hypothetical protein
MQETLSIEVTPAEQALLKRLAATRKVKVSTVLRDSIQRAAAGARPGELPSSYDLVARYCERPGWIGASGVGDL